MLANRVNVALDPAKAVSNRTKHGISLQAAVHSYWETAPEREDDRFDDGALVFVAIAMIGARLHVMVFTEAADDDTARVMSLRPAEKHEARL